MHKIAVVVAYIVTLVASSLAFAAGKDVTLTWDAPTNSGAGLNHYVIYSDQCVPGGPFYVMTSRDVSLPRSLTIVSVPPGTCRYRVTAVDTLNQESPVSNVATATIVAPPPPPSAPANLVATVAP